MSVSHYLVSSIQVVGLVVGLVGCFYLSLGLFGKTDMDVYRPLLPAAAAAIGGGFACWALSVVFPTTQIKSASIVTLDYVFAVLMAIVIFIAVYCLGLVVRHALHRQLNVAMLSHVIVTVVPVFIVLIGVSNLQTDQGFAFAVAHATIPAAIGVAVSIPTVAILFLSERRLQVIGFALTAFAILTQFIPPVLDVLNILITK